MVRIDKQLVYLDASKRKRKEPRKRKTNLVRNKLTNEDKKSLRYNQFEALYAMWCSYFADLTGMSRGKASIDERLLKADYHGALLMVTEANNESMIGICGIVVLETRYTLQLITKLDRYVVIPKQGSVFQFVLEGKVFSLFGDAMRQRPELRGKRTRLRGTLPILLK